MRPALPYLWRSFVLVGCFWCGTARPQSLPLITSWPEANGTIHTMVLDEGAGVLYLGGEFTSVGGQARTRLAAIDITSGNVTAWAPAADLAVRAIAVRGDSVIVGGNFLTVNGTPRSRLAAIEATTGSLLPWAPVTNGPVLCLFASSSVIYAGGQFNSVDGNTRNQAAAFDAATGALNAWNPDADAQVRDIRMNGANMLIAGHFLNVGGASRTLVAEVDPVTGAPTPWAPVVTGSSVLSIAVLDGAVHLCGSFSHVNSVLRSNVASVDAADGTLLPWAPTVGALNSIAAANGVVCIGGNFSLVNGIPHAGLAAFPVANSTLLPGSPSANGTVNEVILTNDRLYVGGTFTSVNGIARASLAAFDICTPQNWFTDLDGDGFGDPLTATNTCPAPSGHVANGTDCNDADAAVHGPMDWHADADGDGFGASAVAFNACSAGPGFVTDMTDCDDANGLVLGPQTYFADADGDGFGDALVQQTTCSPPVGFVLDNTDCADNNGSLFPGASCDDGDPSTVGDLYNTACTCIGGAVDVAARVFLEGPFNGGAMSDGLRSAGLIPLLEPYTDLEFHPLTEGGGEEVDPAVLTTTGPDAVVDWIMLTIRDDDPPYDPKSIRMALLQRDGDVVDLTGNGPVRFSRPPGDYYLEVRHRNHLGIMTGVPMPLTPTGTVIGVDFTLPSTACFGSNAQKNIGGTMVLWAGNTVNNGLVSYTGSENDRDPILVRVGSTVPTGTTIGYHAEDVNMDGVVKYTGTSNDRDPIVVNVGGSTPNNTRAEQLP